MELYFIKIKTFRDFLRIIFSYKLMICVIILTALVTVYLAMKLRTPVYSGVVKLMVMGHKKYEADVYTEILDARFTSAATQQELVISTHVLERVVKALKLYLRPPDYEKQFASRLKRLLIEQRLKNRDVELERMAMEQNIPFQINNAVGELQNKITVERLGTSAMFYISVNDFSPRMALLIANSLSRSYVIFDMEQQIQELQLKYGEKHLTVMQLKQYIKELESHLDGEPMPKLEAFGPASVKIIEQAQVGEVKTMKVSKNSAIVMAFFLSLFTGVMFALVLDYLDQTIKSAQEIESFLDIPFLGSIPRRKSRENLLIDFSRPGTRYTDSFRNLGDHIYLSMRNANLKSLLLTDAQSSKEAAAIIGNLAIYLSYKAGCRVLIIDANLRNSLISKIFEISNSPGVIDVLEEQISFVDAVKYWDTNLSILPSGKDVSNPIPLLESTKMSELIRQAKEQYEIILLNCENLVSFNDSRILANLTDGVAIAMNESKVRRIILKHAILPLELNKVKIIGAILNNRKYVIPEIIYRIT